MQSVSIAGLATKILNLLTAVADHIEICKP